MKKKGFTLIELLVVIAIIALLMGILMPALNKARALAIQLVCGTNLKGLGSAMLVYTSYADDDYPRAGGPGSWWTAAGKIQRAFAPLFEDAFADLVIAADTGQVTTPGQATITSSFYLLVKHSKVTPKQFLCRGDAGVTEFKITRFARSARNVRTDLSLGWDFGDASREGGRTGAQLPYPGEMVSYTYHMPYSQQGSVETFVIVDQTNPAMLMAADRNPYLDKRNVPVTALPDPTDTSAVQNFNCFAHSNRGQNVLYKDGHVKFENSPCIGLADDNIYTWRASGADATLGTPPSDDGDAAAYPGDDRDALLVGERNGRSGI
ncbi:MAG TPA: type II secretion system protein [Sedimentisphaerales bacterium]|nr:type II secretion system protein [Sedimentisphaerales bacterium]